MRQSDGILAATFYVFAVSIPTLIFPIFAIIFNSMFLLFQYLHWYFPFYHFLAFDSLEHTCSYLTWATFAFWGEHIADLWFFSSNWKKFQRKDLLVGMNFLSRVILTERSSLIVRLVTKLATKVIKRRSPLIVLLARIEFGAKSLNILLGIHTKLRFAFLFSSENKSDCERHNLICKNDKYYEKLNMAIHISRNSLDLEMLNQIIIIQTCKFCEVTYVAMVVLFAIFHLKISLSTLPWIFQVTFHWVTCDIMLHM